MKLSASQQEARRAEHSVKPSVSQQDSRRAALQASIAEAQAELMAIEGVKREPPACSSPFRRMVTAFAEETSVCPVSIDDSEGEP